jgi:hypothetical protein
LASSKEVKTPFGIIYPNRTERPPAYDSNGNPKRQNIHHHRAAPRAKAGSRCVTCGEKIEETEE